MYKLVISLLLMLATTGASAADDAAEGAGEAVRKALSSIAPGVVPDSIERVDAPAWYEVVIGPDVVYISEDGRYMFQGDMMDMKSRTNVTEERRAAGRLELIEQIPESSMIVFSPPKPEHTITVFTDIDCPYCRKMHQEMAEYNKLGIAVRYLAFPRTGVGSKSYKKAVAVWCAEDRKAAMTEAKQGNDPAEKVCDDPVDEHLAAVQALGLDGTPTLILEDGTKIPGYVPAQRLKAALEQQ